MRRAVGIVRAAPPAVWAFLATAVVVVAVAGNWLLPWLTRDTYVRVSTPVPPQGFGVTPMNLERGKPVCINDVLLPAATQVAALGGNPGANKRPPAIDVTVTAPGYRHATTIEPGWPRGLTFDLPSPKGDVIGRICLETRARRPVVLNANAGPTVRAYTTVDGERTGAPVSIELRRTDPESRLSRLGTTIDRAMDFSWRPLGGGFGRLLAVLVVLLVGVGSVAALLWAMEADRRGPRAGGPDEEDPVLTTYHDAS